MKNIVPFSLCILMLLLFSACPYQSTIPLSNQTEKWDRKHLDTYTGKWVCSKEDYDLDSVNIEFKNPSNPDNALIITTWDGLTNKKYNAWITQVGDWNAGYLNLLYVEIKDDTKTTYAIYKFEQTGNMAGIQEANPDVFHTISYSTTEQLREHLLRFHKEKTANAFGKPITWFKKNK